MIRLTEVAQSIVRSVIQRGEAAIDATAGNGHDTLFLLECVGPSGRVFAFDIQPEALARTASRVGNAGNVELIECDHASMYGAVAEEFHGRIGAVMFNLGYLPGGKKSTITRASSTLQALEAALGLLRTAGVMTVVAYTGHEGGFEEAESVSRFLSGLSTNEYTTRIVKSERDSKISPGLFVIYKEATTG